MTDNLKNTTDSSAPQLTVSLYEDWDAINTPTLSNQLVDTFYSSCRRGNQPTVTPDNTLGIIANAQHNALRGVVDKTGRLMNPACQPDPHVLAAYNALQSNNDAYQVCMRRAKNLHDILHGSQSSRSAKIPQASLESHLKSKPIFGNQESLYGSLYDLEKTFKLPEKLERFCVKKLAFYRNIKTYYHLFELDQALKRQSEIHLGHKPQHTIPVKNILLHTHDNNTHDEDNQTTLGMKFIYLRQMREAILDTTVVSPVLSKQIMKHFSTAERIYRSTRNMLFNAGIADEPIVLQNFQDEKELLIQRIAGQIEYPQLLKDIQTKKNETALIQRLGLNDRDTFETAREIYRKRKSSPPEHNTPSAKRPVMHKAGCPFQ